MDYRKKQKIDSCIDELGRSYLSNTTDYYYSIQKFVDELNNEEVEYLNNNLELHKIVGVERGNVLNYLLENKQKIRFTEFILKSTNIDLDVNHISNSNKSAFILLAENYLTESNELLKWIIKIIFRRGYVVTKNDEIFLKDLYKKIEFKEQFENWSILRFALKLNNKEQVSLALDKLNILFVILSLKLNKPVFFNFPNLLGVLNNAFNSEFYKSNGDIILKALEVYSRKESVNELDSRKGVFRKKIFLYEQDKPVQNKEFEEITKKIFPELE